MIDRVESVFHLGGIAMPRSGVLSLLFASFALMAAAPPRLAPFPLRTDPPPTDWRLKEINEGLPYREPKGAVHVLVWEVIEDDRPWKYTQILVLKRYDRPTFFGVERGRWLLAQLYHDPKRQAQARAGAITLPAWSKPMLREAPVLPGGKMMPKLTDAHVFGHEFYKDPPTDSQVEAFLRETRWTPTLGSHEAFDRTITTRKLTAGGIDRAAWKKLFGRDVPTDLFPELKKLKIDDSKVTEALTPRSQRP
jgi:hypothetical protein